MYGKGLWQTGLACFAVLSTSLTTGCVSAQLQTAGNTILVGQCRSLFFSEAYGSYMEAAKSPFAKAAFALASDNGMQACATASNLANDPQAVEPSQIAATAIARCEAIKSPSIRTPCTLFADDGAIVWNPPAPLPAPPVVVPIAQPQVTESAPQMGSGGSLEDAKTKCAQLGYVRGTPKFGQCVLKLTQ